MSISVTDLFSIGIGPSSSHTVGPLRAAEAFLSANNCPDDSEIAITLHGSLAATGIGHGTDRAAILGLAGYTPITLTPDVKPVLAPQFPPKEQSVDLEARYVIASFSTQFHYQNTLMR